MIKETIRNREICQVWQLTGKPKGKIQKMVSTRRCDEDSERRNSDRENEASCEIGQTRNLDFERSSTSWIIYNDGRVESYNNSSELFADNCPRNYS